MRDSRQQDNSEISEFSLAEQISRILENQPPAMKRKALNLVASQIQCRLVPIGIPVGTIVSPQSTGSKSKKDRHSNKSKSSYWKNDDRCKTIVQQRETLLKELKAIAPGSKEAQSKLKELRMAEQALKDRKAELSPALDQAGSSSSASKIGKGVTKSKKGKNPI